MTTRPPTCHRWDMLAQAVAVMRDRSANWLVVLDYRGRCVGSLTARDACLAALERSAPLDGVLVEAAMRVGAPVCHAADTVGDSLRTMREHRIARLAVVDEAGMLVGVVSLGAMARRVDVGARAEIATTLASVGPRSAR